MLQGAPALVMAVNRQAQCQCTIDAVNQGANQAANQASNQATSQPRRTDRWMFTSTGFRSSSQHTFAELRDPDGLSANDPARLCAYLLEAYQAHTGSSARTLDQTLGGWRHSGIDWPARLTLQLNTQQMYHQDMKLGLGSSAALTVALLGVIHELIHGGPSRKAAATETTDLVPGLSKSDAFTIAHSAHQASQGGVGSGLDIATSLNGGLIRFQAGQIEPAIWPRELHHLFVYAGVPASTTELVNRFNRWHNNGTPKALEQLKLAASKLADSAINIDNLDRYISALKSLDRVANIGIFSAEHLWVSQLAERIGVLYKPCGAGGGDLGIALSDQPKLLEAFRDEVNDHTTNTHLTNRPAIIDLELAPHGLTVG